jgi:hypothetical protein
MTTPQTVQVNWQALPNGQEILVQAGVYYAVVALVDVPAAKIHSMASGYGLSIIDSTYVDSVDPSSTTPPLPPAPSGYRYVAGQAVGQQSGATIPWSVPSPWSLFDSSTLVNAWAGEPAGSSQPLPAVTCPAKPSPWPAAAAGAAAGIVLVEGVRWLFFRR